MNNTIKIADHYATVNFDPEIEMFRGEFIGLRGGAEFYATSVQELHREGEISLRVFLEACKEEGIEPYKSYSGKISARLGPKRHEALEHIAAAHGESINHLINEGADLIIQRYA